MTDRTGDIGDRGDHDQPETNLGAVAKNRSDHALVILDGHAELPRTLLGDKAFGINSMRGYGLPVPPAFCLTTEVCARFFADPAECLDNVWADVRAKMAWLESETARTFGSGPRPLLVSVRSGAAQSMPGMLDTVLNVGIDDLVESALASEFGTAFARDTRHRSAEIFSRIAAGPETVTPSSPASGPPSEPWIQLRRAIEAVFGSWLNPRAVAYRNHHGLDATAGTAVVVQAMAFGNLGPGSGTGVLFSRNPMTGDRAPFGEWLPGGQGEDVVSGDADVESLTVLRHDNPAVYRELISAAELLEKSAGDIQDIEFTVEDSSLWLLQTRTARRSPPAAVRLALQLHDEGVIDGRETLRRVGPAHLHALRQPWAEPESRSTSRPIATGLPACPGVSSGRAYDDIDEAIDAADRGEDVILVRSATSPADVSGMLVARGIVTEVGGATSHAAVVSRELGLPAVVGCGPGTIARLRGRVVTVDGSAGDVHDGILAGRAWSETTTPELLRLADIARGLSPLRAHAGGNYPALTDNSPAAVSAAISAGITDVVSTQPLTTMMTALGFT